MTPSNNPFPSNEEEVTRAANELADIKTQIKEFLAKLTQIEKRLHALAPVTKAKPAAKKTKTEVGELSGEYLSAKYEGLSIKFKSNNADVLAELQEMPKDELFALAKHLGCKTTKTAKKETLTELVLGRLRESKLLGSGIV